VVHLEELKLVVYCNVYERCECVIRHAYIDVILWPGWLVLIDFITLCDYNNYFSVPF